MIIAICSFILISSALCSLLRSPFADVPQYCKLILEELKKSADPKNRPQIDTFLGAFYSSYSMAFKSPPYMDSLEAPFHLYQSFHQKALLRRMIEVPVMTLLSKRAHADFTLWDQLEKISEKKRSLLYRQISSKVPRPTSLNPIQVLKEEGESVIKIGETLISFVDAQENIGKDLRVDVSNWISNRIDGFHGAVLTVMGLFNSLDTASLASMVFNFPSQTEKLTCQSLRLAHEPVNMFPSQIIQDSVISYGMENYTGVNKNDIKKYHGKITPHIHCSLDNAIMLNCFRRFYDKSSPTEWLFVDTVNDKSPVPHSGNSLIRFPSISTINYVHSSARNLQLDMQSVYRDKTFMLHEMVEKRSNGNHFASIVLSSVLHRLNIDLLNMDFEMRTSITTIMYNGKPVSGRRPLGPTISNLNIARLLTRILQLVHNDKLRMRLMASDTCKCTPMISKIIKRTQSTTIVYNAEIDSFEAKKSVDHFFTHLFMNGMDPHSHPDDTIMYLEFIVYQHQLAKRWGVPINTPKILAYLVNLKHKSLV